MTDMPMHPEVMAVTADIVRRSQASRSAYLDMLGNMASDQPARSQVSCTNLAHVFAASDASEKLILKERHRGHNIGIVSAYNDMLSAHQPYHDYPQMIKTELYKLGCTAQVAGGVPAMCDGVTQGQTGMELSLFSRDTIALSTAVALSHQVFDGMLLLGICDKIVPGMLMGALRFGHLPGLFIPAGPMPSGISNQQKAQVRQRYVEGKVDEQGLLESEAAAYHAPGTCTFYGTANSNQMLLEAMGLVLPGAAFEPPSSQSRTHFNQQACRTIQQLTEAGESYQLGRLVTAQSIVNALVVLLATGGSTNLSIHWIAVAKAAGWLITWEDMNRLSKVVPLLCRVYPNGEHDINSFHQAGGTAWVFSQLMAAGLMDASPFTVNLSPMEAYALRDGQAPKNENASILASCQQPFSSNGGLVVVQGNIARAIVKVSAVDTDRQSIQAPAKVFHDQEQVLHAYQNGELNQDVVVVVTHQGPKANGMPELHKLMPILASLQDQGFKVALLTDGRLSGASGKVLAAIHCVPEAVQGGAIGKIQTGDLVALDAHRGSLNVLNVSNETLLSRQSVSPHIVQHGVGRELFRVFRQNVTAADQGAISIDWFEAK